MDATLPPAPAAAAARASVRWESAVDAMAHLAFPTAVQGAIEGAKRFCDPETTPAQRTAQLGHMLDALETGAPRLAADFIGPGVAGAVRTAADAMPAGASWLGRLEGLASKLEAIAADPKGPEAQSTFERVSKYLRTVARIERDNLERVALHLPPAALPQVQEAVRRYAIDMATLLAGDAPTGGLSADQRAKAFDAIHGALRPDAPELNAERAGVLVEALDAIVGTASSALSGLTSFDHATHSEVERLSQRLCDTVSGLVDATPAARNAVSNLARDARLMGELGVAVSGLVSSLKGADEPCDAATRQAKVVQVRKGLEGLGRGFTKYLQSIFNEIESAEEAAKVVQSFFKGRFVAPLVTAGLLPAPNDAQAALLGEALMQLREEVSPMSDRELHQQMSIAFKTENWRALFKHFQDKPIGSGTMAQNHYCVLHDGREIALKVFKPNLDKGFDDDIRKFELIGRYLHFPVMGEYARQIINPFRIEGDAVREAGEQRRGHANAKGQEDVRVPQVIETFADGTPLCTDRTIASEFYRFYGLDEYVKAVRVATHARSRAATQAPTGPVADAADARVRAEWWAAMTYGAEPSHIEVQPDPKGYAITLRYEKSRLYPEVHAHLSTEGKMESQDRAPELSRASLERLRRSLRTTAAIFLIHGHAQGDPQKGNVKVLPNGSILVLDWGQTLNLGFRSILGFVRFQFGAIKGNTQAMARGLVDMSSERASLSREQRKERVDALAKEIEARFARRQIDPADVAERKKVLAQVGRELAAEKKLQISDLSQLTKSYGAMMANLRSVGHFTDEPKGTLKDTAVEVLGACLNDAFARFFGSTLDETKRRGALDMGAIYDVAEAA